MRFLKKSGVVVLKEPKPGTCGGTTATLDTNAPKEITSENMILFDVTSALNPPRELYGAPDKTVGYISAYAANSGAGTFLFLETCAGHFRRGERNGGWAYVKENVMPKLAELTRECGLAKKNGFHSKTHGLPENFGGDIDVRYSSGERISVSNNQSPVIPYETGIKIKEFFDLAMKTEKVVLPDVSSLISVVFEEKRKNCGFTNANLTFEPDGSGINKKTCRYDDPKIYESTKAVETEGIDLIKRSITENGVLAWAGLPDGGYSFTGDKQLTFIFKDADSITVKGGKILPDRIRGGFFNIELEMTTKH